MKDQQQRLGDLLSLKPQKVERAPKSKRVYTKPVTRFIEPHCGCGSPYKMKGVEQRNSVPYLELECMAGECWEPSRRISEVVHPLRNIGGRH